MTIGDLREWVEALPRDCDEEEIVVLFDNTIHDIADVVYYPLPRAGDCARRPNVRRNLHVDHTERENDLMAVRQVRRSEIRRGASGRRLG